MFLVLYRLSITNFFVMTFVSSNHEHLFMNHISGISATFQLTIKHHFFLVSLIGLFSTSKYIPFDALDIDIRRFGMNIKPVRQLSN